MYVKSYVSFSQKIWIRINERILSISQNCTQLSQFAIWRNYRFFFFFYIDFFSGSSSLSLLFVYLISSPVFTIFNIRLFWINFVISKRLEPIGDLIRTTMETESQNTWISLSFGFVEDYLKEGITETFNKILKNFYIICYSCAYLLRSVLISPFPTWIFYLFIWNHI